MSEPQNPLGAALRRFGLAGGPGEAAAMGRDPRGALLAQLAAPHEAPAAEMLDSNGALAFYARNRDAQVARSQARRAAELAGASVEATRNMAVGNASDTGLHAREANWLLGLARDTPDPFRERLALFWTNHFTVSGEGSTVAWGLAGPFQREAIRPHLLGRFEDMLLAAVLHPAMLFYLDNVSSVARNSPTGGGRRGGVNENLAREALELHAMGADGGYTQADVTEFAEALSGWVVGYPGGPPRTGGDSTAGEVPEGVYFQAARHAPGPKQILGTTFPEAGAEEARAVLRAVARHPSTARHVARRMATHFVSDPPPPTLVEALSRTFRDTGGDLRAVTAALLRAPEAWSTAPAKLRPPLEFVMAVTRLTGQIPEQPPALAALRAMGQPWYRAPSPKGWDETNDGWATPDGIKTRLDWVRRLAARTDPRTDPRALAEQALGPALSPPTRRAIAGAESVPQGITLLLLSPEMQRR